MRRFLVVLALLLAACTTTDTALAPDKQDEVAAATELAALTLIDQRCMGARNLSRWWPST